MGKPFFYKFTSADLALAVLQIPQGQHEQWLKQLVSDLVNAEGNLDFSIKLIGEVKEYREKQAAYGAKGGKPKHRVPKGALGSDTLPIGNSINSNNKTNTGRFTPPTVEQIKEYCLERGNGIDAQYFHDHYQARGWIPKGYKVQMKDWKAVIRTWESNNKKQQLALVPPKGDDY